MTYRLSNTVYNFLLYTIQIMQIHAEQKNKVPHCQQFDVHLFLYINGHIYIFIDTQRNFFYVKRFILLTLFCNLIF